jgi:hypothetical protein
MLESDPLCVSLGGWDGLCSPTEVPGKNVGVTEKEDGTGSVLRLKCRGRMWGRRFSLHPLFILRHSAPRAAENNRRVYTVKKVYRSCIALFYRKRLPQQQRDR